MSTSEGVDVVYGVHAFEAENPDELSFGAGERIVVLEKDDQYQDGWWQGVNTKGERGLFPQTYTQSSPPTVVTSTPVVAQDGFSATPAVVEKPRSRSPSPTRPAETPEMRATIDDIQSHLDGMYLGKETSAVAALPGTVAPNSASTEPKALASIPAPTNQDDTCSVASASIRDDASSVLDRDVEETEANGDMIASHAKDNLARNIQLAQEREEKKRVADEREREAERERMRMASSQPVEGLVFSDESDAESAVGDESDGDDDSIFPTKRQAAEERDTSQYASVPQELDEASRTPQLGSRADRASVSTAIALPPTASPAAAQTTEQQPRLYLVDRPAQLEHQDSDAPSSYQVTPLQSPPVPQAPESAVYPTSPLNDSPEDLLALPAATEMHTVAESEPIPSVQPIASATQPTRHSGGRRSIDAGVAPGEAGLISLVEQATASSPVPAAYAFPAQSPASIQTSGPQNASYSTTQHQPTSPHPSNAASSRPSSTLGTAFTPATSAQNYLDSPRSGTFGGSRNSNQSDPRDWSVDQVVEWGQSRAFDASILAKFREHEISGDVLLDMDINSLKEIDIIAFGPRARIAKAIKDLRAQFDMTTSLSPSLSGYDSGPGSLAATSPAVNSLRDGSFAPSSSLPTTYESDGQATKALTPTQVPTTPDLASSSAASGVQDDYLRGLGLGQASTATALPSTRQASQAPGSPVPFSENVVSKPTDTPKTTRTRHTTGGTEDSFETAEDMRDDVASTTPSDSTEAASRSERKPKTSLGSFRTRDRQKSSGPGASSLGSSPGGPASPEIGADGGKYGKSAGRSFFSNTLGRSRKPPPTYTGESTATPAASSTTTAERSSGMQRSPSSNTGNRLSARLFGIGNNQTGTSQTTGATGSSHERGKRSISLPLEAGAPVKSPTIPEEAAASPVSNARHTPRPSAPVTRGSREAVPTTATQAPAAGALANSTGVVRAVDKIGEADYAGYLRKRSDRYNSWKERYLVLKGTYLYVLKSPTEDKVKHYINLVGYRFVSDGSVGSGLGDRGRYGFKATHPTEQTHFFSSGDSVTTRNWMKAFLKVTIGRDYAAPVTSSSNIKTIPLSVAQSMNPPPRPPSPTSAVRVQKASLTSNPNTLSATDAAKLMGASVLPTSGAMDRGASMQSNGRSPPVSPTKRKNSSFLPPLKSSQRKKPVSEDFTDPRRSPTSAFGNFDERPPSSLGRNERRSSWYGKALGGGSSSASPKASMDNSSFSPNSNIGPATGQGQGNALSPVLSGVAASSPQGVDRRPSALSTFTMNPSQELLDWVNDHLPNGTAKAFEWSDMSSGRIYTRLVEHLGGKKSGIDEAAFDKFRPLQPGRTPDMDYIDTLFRCFDFLLDRGVKTDDVSINDLMTGNQPHLIKLAEIIRTRFET